MLDNRKKSGPSTYYLKAQLLCRLANEYEESSPFFEILVVTPRFSYCSKDPGFLFRLKAWLIYYSVTY